MSSAAMELGGWSRYENVLHYAHLVPDHLAPHADAVTIWAQDGSASTGVLERGAGWGGADGGAPARLSA